MGRTLQEIEDEIARTQAELASVQGTETEVYARIVGYYRAVRNWNRGKRDEFNHRKLFDIENTETTSYTLTTQNQGCTYEVTEKKQEQAETIPGIQNETPVQEIPQEGYYELFTRKTCPNCPPVKEFMNEVSLSGKNIDVDTEEGLSEAAEKGVFASPTVIIYDSNGNEKARAHSVEELSVIFEKVAVGA
ncbi:MAG: hypothetical protein II367_07060 [Treponema sp.]|nr:hypothetical protein [Treponema sp.]